MTPAVMLLHGFTHTGSSWDPVVAALGERYRALTPDIRGHGSASEVVPVTLDGEIADLGRQAPAPGFTMVGYSMGGRIALHCALAIRTRVQRLVLIGASPGIADLVEREDRRLADDRLAEEIERSTIEEFARRWAQTPGLAGLSDETLARVHADRLRSTPGGLAQALRGLGTGALPSLWERLGELRMPVTLVVGERDQKFRQIAQRMAEAIGDVELLVVPGVGHAVHLESPERVASIIARGSG
jgi:2-succinyl-6-hydroxy-2,4-cyclohexadiene-1-carboxylate synthase